MLRNSKALFIAKEAMAEKLYYKFFYCCSRKAFYSYYIISSGDLEKIE